ncbi:MAG TPA: xanthine dehydrogenase family protein subunit M [Microbacteriaceae bacterium]|nr:xanthine dehydrogenase family protein subunit M [Microbacteriaceae bacterium]
MQISAPFDYARATSVDDAIALLDKFGEESRVIAGGHSLLPMMKLRLARPEALVDINELAELEYIVEEDDHVRIGSMTRHYELIASPILQRRFPIFGDAGRVIADPLVRNRGTIGGSLCQADPGEDLTAVCIVLDTTVVLRGPNGERTLTMSEFHRGPYETAAEHNEILVELRVPIRPHSGSAYEKVERRVGDYAVAASGAAVALGQDGTIAEIGIGLAAVGLDDRPAEAEAVLRGKAPTDELITQAARLTAVAVDPIDDLRGTAEYKRHLAEELTRRVIVRAIARAKGAQS